MVDESSSFKFSSSSRCPRLLLDSSSPMSDSEDDGSNSEASPKSFEDNQVQRLLALSGTRKKLLSKDDPKLREAAVSEAVSGFKRNATNKQALADAKGKGKQPVRGAGKKGNNKKVFFLSSSQQIFID